METSTMVSSTVSLPVARSRWRGLRAMSSPQRRPVLIAVSTISRCWAGSAARIASYSVGGEGAGLLLDTLGSSVWAQGLKVTTRSTQGAFEDRVQHGVVLAHRGGGEAVRRWRW